MKGSRQRSRPPDAILGGTIRDRYTVPDEEPSPWTIYEYPPQELGGESIADVVGYPNQWNPCTHTRWSDFPIGGSTSWLNPGNGAIFERIVEGYTNPQGFNTTPSPDADKVAEAHWDAMSQFSGELPAHVLAPNFLYELPQLRNLGDFIIRPGSPLKRAASAHLGWNFGVKPFIGDLRRLARSIAGVAGRIEWHERNSGKPVRVHFQADVTPVWYNPTIEIGIGSKRYDFIQGLTIKYNASALVRFNMPQRSPLENRLRYLADVMGFSRPMSVAWEATPYSFVVDWFYDVGSLADKFTLDAWDVRYEVLEAGYSITTHYDVEQRLYSPHQDYNPNNFVVACRRKLQKYARHVGIPAKLPVPAGLDSPSLQQLMTGLALLVQRVPNRYLTP